MDTAQIDPRSTAGVEWTVVRSSWFNQNFSQAEFLGMVLTEDSHSGEIYEVSGPRMLTFTETEREISRGARRKVEFVGIPREVFAAAISDAGAPDEMAWLLDRRISRLSARGRGKWVASIFAAVWKKSKSGRFQMRLAQKVTRVTA